MSSWSRQEPRLHIHTHLFTKWLFISEILCTSYHKERDFTFVVSSSRFFKCMNKPLSYSLLLNGSVHEPWHAITSFPGLPTVQFLIAYGMQKGGGRPGPFYHVSDVNVYLLRHKGGGTSLTKRTSWKPFLVASV